MEYKKLYFQVAELTRLSQTLMLMQNIHWLVSEDAPTPTQSVLEFLEECPVAHTYLLGKFKFLVDFKVDNSFFLSS